jgi:hypothetical protein
VPRTSPAETVAATPKAALPVAREAIAAVTTVTMTAVTSATWRTLPAPMPTALRDMAVPA